MTSQVVTRAPPPTTIDVSRCERRGQPRPQSLLGCLPNPPVSSSTQAEAAGEEREGRGKGVLSRPMATQAATRALSSPLPPYARPSEVCRMLHHLRQSRASCCAQATSPATAPATPAPATTPFDPLVAVVDSSSMRWTLPPPERREKGGAVEATRPPRLPPAPCH
jgi:hypothetical protein